MFVPILTLAGCGGEPPAGDPAPGASARESNGPRVIRAADPQSAKLAYVTLNASDFWRIAAAGVRAYEKEAGVKVDVKMPANGTVAEQNAILEDLVSQEYNGIAIGVIAPQDQSQRISRACKTANVICQDSDAPDSDRLVYIGTNNYEAGKTLGENVVKLLPNGGKAAVFVGTFSADNAQQRLKGIQDAIAGHSIEIVARKEDNKDPNKARTNVEDVINGQPDINLLIGLWSYNGSAIAAAIDSSGNRGKILAAVFDEDEGTLTGVENGTIACTVVQKPFQFGYLSARLLHQLATTGAEALKDPQIQDGKIDTGIEVVTAENVKAFRTRLAEMTR